MESEVGPRKVLRTSEDGSASGAASMANDARSKYKLRTSEDEFENYDIFISHRGPNTKTGFAGFLYDGLEYVGLRPFLDCISIHKGQDPLTCTEHAIKTTQIAIIIFSENYTQSAQCLRELHLMLETPGVKVLPVFFNIEPWEVRFVEKGRLSEGFAELKRRHDAAFIDMWRGDLERASKLKGLKYGEDERFEVRLEKDLVKKIVGISVEWAKKTLPLDVGEHVHGVDMVAQDIINKLDQKRSISMLGLWGSAGIGKSTLAKELYNRLGRRFEASTFVEDVRDKMMQGGIAKVQGCLLKDLCMSQSDGIDDISRGKAVLEWELWDKRILMVLDDVCVNVEMEYLISRKMLSPGSMCIITSRDKRVLQSTRSFDLTNEVYIHNVQQLGYEDSKQVFTSFALGSGLTISDELEQLVSSITKACGGVPLVLKVCGALLKDEDNMDIWKDVLKNLRCGSIMDEKMFKCLRSSFDALNAQEREMFLDIACAVHGQSQDIAIQVWRSRGLSARLGVRRLVEMALVTVDEFGRFGMHDLLQDMARVIVKEEEMREGVTRRLRDLESLKMSRIDEDQSHGADMPVDVDNVKFQVGMEDVVDVDDDDMDMEDVVDVDDDDMDMEDVVDVDDDAQECKDELSSMADFQDFQAANAVGVPSLSTVVLEDQTHEVEMTNDVDNVESILTTSTDVGRPSSLNASHGYSESSGTMWALTRPDCSDSSAYAQGNAAAMEQLGSYLRLGKHCLEAVQSGTSSLKFNIDQCGYLADKLQMVVWSASAYLDVLRGDPNLSMDVAEVVEVFKFLRTLAKQIESFVHGCCQQSWIQSAMMLTNVWEYVASVGFNLELCRAAFCRECGCLSLAEVEEIHKVEVEVVKKKAFSDVDALSQKILLEGPSLSDEDKDLSFYLLRRLNQIRPIPGVIPHLCDGSIACDGGWIGRLYKWVKPSVQLGRGASGTVHKAMWLGTPVARKTFLGQQNPDFMKEVEILSALSHPNVMSMFCSGETNQGCCAIVMELMDEDLHMLMERRLEEKSSSSSGCPSPFPILEAVDLMLQIGEGGKYLHDQGIAHRDLKAMNILAKNLSGEDLDGYVHVKVADFGLSKTKEKSIRYSTMSVNVGSNRWMAPEIIRLSGSDQGRSSSIEGPKHPLKRDIYSYGMVCFEILTGRVPFPSVCSEIEVKSLVLQGKRPILPEDPQKCPLLLKELIESCWSSNPKERPTFMAICSALKYLKYLLMTSYCQGQKIDKVSARPNCVDISASISSMTPRLLKGRADDMNVLEPEAFGEPAKLP